MRAPSVLVVLLAVGALAVSACSSSSGGSAAPTTGASPTTSPTTTATTTTAPPATTTVVPGTQLAGDVAFLGPIRKVPVGAITVAFRQFGTGPDLLLIAGQASPMSIWPATMLRHLAQTRRVTIYDNRDLGDTTTTTAPFTLSDLADDAAGLITALGLRHPAVFGWSTGGEIGLLLAVRHPAALSRLAITGATPGGPHSVLPSEAVNALFADPDPDVNALFDTLFSATPDGAAGKQSFLADYMKVPQGTVTATSTALYDKAERKLWADPEPDLASIRIPVLVMNGAGDYAVPSANATYIAQRIGKNATLALDPGGRHAWFVEHPAHFDSLMATFLG